MAVEDDHTICDRMEHPPREHAGEAVINIHIEPEREAKRTGIVVLQGRPAQSARHDDEFFADERSIASYRR
jgi:hypothetical protein